MIRRNPVNVFGPLGNSPGPVVASAVIVAWYRSGASRVFWVRPDRILDEAAKRSKVASVYALSVKAAGPRSPTWQWNRPEDPDAS